MQLKLTFVAERVFALAKERLAPDGILLFSSNFRRFKLDPALSRDYEVADITRQTIPRDFSRNPRIHTCFRITRQGPPRRTRSARVEKGFPPKPVTRSPARPKGAQDGD